MTLMKTFRSNGKNIIYERDLSYKYTYAEFWIALDKMSEIVDAACGKVGNK